MIAVELVSRGVLSCWKHEACRAPARARTPRSLYVRSIRRQLCVHEPLTAMLLRKRSLASGPATGRGGLPPGQLPHSPSGGVPTRFLLCIVLATDRVDRSVMDQPWVIVGAGDRRAKLKLAPATILTLPNAGHRGLER